jgi:hypothetical protein
MTPQKQKGRPATRELTLKKAIRAAKLRSANRVCDHVALIPALAAIIGGLTNIEVREAIGAYESAIIRATSIELQMRYICLAITAYAVMMRGVHTAWRFTYPPLLKQCARYSGIGARYYVEDLRAFCEAVIAHIWPEILA